MKMPLRTGFLCLLLLMAGSCKNRLQKHGELFSDLMKSSDGIFRGLHLGDSPDIVQQAETITPTEEDNASLMYEMQLGGSGTCKIIYGFENKHLFEILAEASFENQKDGLEMLYGFRDYFNEKYGPYEKERGNLVWKVKGNGEDAGAILEMTDESEFSYLGLWSLSIYKPLISNEVAADSLIIN